MPPPESNAMSNRPAPLNPEWLETFDNYHDFIPDDVLDAANADDRTGVIAGDVVREQKAGCAAGATASSR